MKVHWRLLSSLVGRCVGLSFSLAGLSHRDDYSQFLREMIIQPGISKAKSGCSREDVTMEDHVSPTVLILKDHLRLVLKTKVLSVGRRNDSRWKSGVRTCEDSGSSNQRRTGGGSSDWAWVTRVTSEEPPPSRCVCVCV